MYGLAAMGAFSGFRGGDVARNSLEEINRSLTEMCYELGGRHGFAFALGVSRGHEVGRNNQAERSRVNAGTIGDDEIAKAKEGFVFLPHGNVEEGVCADHEEDAVAGVGVAKVANGVHGIVELIAGEIVAGFGEGWNKVGMVGTGERDHRKTVRKRSEVLLQFVRRADRGDEMNFVEIEAAVGGAGY